MKAKILTLIICLTTLFAFAENGANHSYKYSTKRTIDANFEVSDSSSISLIGKFSDYKISTWNENFVSFHIEIIANADKQEKANEMLYVIDVDFNNNKNKKNITAETVIKKHNIKNVSFQISYHVMVPQYISLSIYNLYGDVLMDEAHNNLYVEMKYGDFSIDEILTYAEINMLYGDANIKKANQISAYLSYGDINVANMNKALINMNYGSAKLDAVNILNGKFNYSDIVLGNVTQSADIDINYCDAKVSNMSDSFELIKMNTNYSDIELHLDEKLSFSYDITLLYGEIKSDMLEKHARKITEKNYQKHISGNINDEEQQHKIVIKGNYSEVE